MVLGKKDKKANEVEDRLRARLAEMENRLDDGTKLRELESHIRLQKEKHELALEAQKVDTDRQLKDKDKEVLEMRNRAAEVVGKWKQAVEAERARYAMLVKDLARLEAQWKAVETTRRSLAQKGLKVDLVPEGPTRSVKEDPRAFVDQLIRQGQDAADRLARIEASFGAGSLDVPASDLDILTSRAAELLTNPELKSKALTVAEKARMFAVDPGKSQYYRELVAPYADAIRQVLEHSSKGSVVYGAQEALAVVETGFRDSRTFLLRRSGALDNHSIKVEVDLERIEENPSDALGRMQAVLDNARALGPVDFFHNMTMEITSRVERGDKGARVAAWILSDVTVTILEDKVVQEWLSGQR